MQKLLICLAALFGPSAALAQSLPSPVFKNLTVNGTITAPEFPNLSSSVEGTGVPGLDGGHWFIWNNPTTFDPNVGLRVSRGVQSGSGVSGATYHSLWVTDWISSTTNAGYEWGFLSEEHSMANASTGAQNVANAGYMFKEIPTNTVATTGASGTGSTATVTFSGGATIPVGYSVLIAGVVPSGYNGVYKVTASSAGSVSFASTTTGAQTVAGAIVNTSVGASWGANFSCEDKTSEADPISGCLGAEIDVAADSATTDAHKQRVGLQIVGAGPSGAHIGTGLMMGTSGSAVIDTGVKLGQSYGVGIDTSAAIFSGNAIQIGQGQTLAFDNSSGWTLQNSSGVMAMQYGAANKMILDNTGNLNTAGGFNTGGAGTAGAWISNTYTKSPAYWVTGSAPTATGTCSINTQVGGNTAGSFKLNGACASGTVILTFATGAANDWACFATDATTPATTISQNNTTASTTTATLKFNATGASGDLIRFSCTGF